MNYTEPRKPFAEPGKTSTGNTPVSSGHIADPRESTLQSAVSDRRLSDAQLLSTLSSEVSNTILFFRVPLYIKIKYIMLDKEKKRIIKQSLIKLVEALSASNESVVQQQTAQQSVVSVNINLQNVELSAPTASDAVYEEKIRLLERKLKHLEEVLAYYKDTIRRLKLAASSGNTRLVLEILRKVE